MRNPHGTLETHGITLHFAEPLLKSTGIHTTDRR